MNAKEIVDNKVYGIKWRLGPFWGQDENIYTWKCGPLSEFGVLPPDIQQGLLGTKTHVAIWLVVYTIVSYGSAFSGMWACLWQLSYVFGGCSTSLPIVTVQGAWLASCNRTWNVACTIILYSRLLRCSDWFTIWSASQQPSRWFIESLRLLEEVVRGRLFLSLFIKSAGQAERSL